MTELSIGSGGQRRYAKLPGEMFWRLNVEGNWIDDQHTDALDMALDDLAVAREALLRDLNADTPATTCDRCKTDGLVIVRGFVDVLEICSFDKHPARVGINAGDVLDLSVIDARDDADSATTMALYCPRCERIVPGTWWIET